ncbi:type II toxin-antitoxin system HigB family toxin [Tunicatimonas pelagia]|uniref:type II toxin-antitoxin system HigB family toxin n=1 Tax=Tunicatimonas pelagia TaxID=931531 RepID=UPI0026666BD7|nr:type II toxin-antitoxin system HigB family toxin [Tunicatimonas pelagia]WKN45957.1 type II toxin-antitoxin system HigB family toxin [Tunicatimonas pelagia]
MRVIAKRTLREFWEKHSDAQSALEEWYLKAERANWQNPNDIISNISNARYLGDNKFSSKIKGNQYRLIVKANFAYQVVYIRFIGTHDGYDKIDVTKL